MGRPKQSLDILQPLDNTRHITLKSGAFGMVSRYGRVVWWSADGEVVGCSIAPAAHHAAASAHHAALGPPRPC